jgi:REP element-mobilizing transposase RayT
MEIGEHFGIQNVNAVRNHLLALERKGYITKGADRSRALRITRKPRALAKVITGLKERIRRHRGIIFALEYHLALATRKGRPHLVDEIRDEVKAGMEQAIANHGWELLQLEIQPDHVLVSVRPGPDHSPERVVRNFKNATAAVWLRHPLRITGRGLWANGFLATTRAEERDALIEDFLAEKRQAPDEEEDEQAPAVVDGPAEPAPDGTKGGSNP